MSCTSQGRFSKIINNPWTSVQRVRGYSDVKSRNQAAGNDLRTKEHEVEELLAALETANLQLETQQNVNTAIMRKKEEV